MDSPALLTMTKSVRFASRRLEPALVNQRAANGEAELAKSFQLVSSKFMKTDVK